MFAWIPPLLKLSSRAAGYTGIGSLPTARPATRQLQQAIELYRGDFLSGFHLSGCQEFEEWHLLKRESLHRQALDALAQLFTYHVGRGDYEQALGYAYRQIELEPWREEAHRWVMRLLAQTGRRSEALAQYVACRKTLAN